MKMNEVQVQETKKTSKFAKAYNKVAKTCIATASAFELGLFKAQVVLADTPATGTTAAGLDAPEIKVNTNANASQIMGKLVGLIFSIFQLVGLLIAVWGLSQVIMGFKDDNPDSKTKGVTFMIVGVLLMCLKALAQGIGLIGQS